MTIADMCVGVSVAIRLEAGDASAASGIGTFLPVWVCASAMVEGAICFVAGAYALNLYVAAPADDSVDVGLSMKAFEAMLFVAPLDGANAEPAADCGLDYAVTWAPECGAGEMTLRGIGVRVAVRVAC